MNFQSVNWGEGASLYGEHQRLPFGSAQQGHRGNRSRPHQK